MTFIIRSDDHFMACGDGNIDITNSIARTNLRTLCIESNSKRSSLLRFFRSPRIVNHALMVLSRQHKSLSQDNWMSYLVWSVTEVHSNNIHTGFTKLADHFHTIRLGTYHYFLVSGRTNQLWRWYWCVDNVLLEHVQYQAITLDNLPKSHYW